MYQSASKKLNHLPPEYKKDLLPTIHNTFNKKGKTIIVLDDDPTGTQTCHDVVVLTSWETKLIQKELVKAPAILFILTNSRSLPQSQAIALVQEIGANIKEASVASQQNFVLISRSDSTLRGHFPGEITAIAESLGITNAITLLIPAFIEGSRFTIDNVHYVVENDELIPVSDTPFANDAVFGYKHSNLTEWVEEKTNGKTKASEVASVSIEDIRIGGPQVVCDKLCTLSPGTFCVINAASYSDLTVCVMGFMLAENAGKKFLYRTSATFVPIRAGLSSAMPYIPDKMSSPSQPGSLIVVGSYVPKSTNQLRWLLINGDFKNFEVHVGEILEDKQLDVKIKQIVELTNHHLASGQDVVIYTGRKQETGNDVESSLKINAFVSRYLVAIMQGISIRPKFIIAKGGITSSDLATKGLSANKALVLGPIIPGVPVWRMDEESKFPGIAYVVFPGNVGPDDGLVKVCNILTKN